MSGKGERKVQKPVTFSVAEGEILQPLVSAEQGSEWSSKGRGRPDRGPHRAWIAMHNKVGKVSFWGAGEEDIRVS